MLKIQLESIDGLPDAIKAEYKKVGDVYLLDTDKVFEDVTPLKDIIDKEKRQRKEATTKVTALEGEVETLKARAGSVPDLEKSWQKKLDDAVTKANGRDEKRVSQIRTLLVDNKAHEIANEISTAPELMLPHIKGRLTLEEGDDGYITRVLDEAGKPSADSVNDLKGKLVADKRFAVIVKASEASGGGANGAKPNPGGKAFKDMNEAEKTALYKSNPAEFDRLSGS